MKYLYINIFLAISLLFTIWLKPETDSAQPKLTQLQEKTQFSVVAKGLTIPWEISWGPDQKIWYTEQKGFVCRVNPLDGKKDTLLKLNDVWYLRTTGLLGMALHDDMNKHPYVFLHYTIQKDKKYLSRLVRYTWQKDTLINPKVLMEIPAANGHNGSRITVHKGLVYWATGDALSLTDSQNPQTPNGKILRMNIDGSVPSDNPLKANLTWAWGFRNIQGMVFSKSGLLYTSEHGDANDDEINLIQKTRNYGWPTVQGFAESVEESSFKGLHQTLDPLKAWTPTIGPAGLDYYGSDKISEIKNSLLLVTLKGKSLRSLKLSADGKQIIEENIFFENKFGRIRDLCVSPAGDIYISTSNRDWNPVAGFPMPEDDRIIKISSLSKSDPQNSISSMPPGSKSAALYQQYCASCHKEDGMGVKGVFPPLQGSQTVVINPKVLISKVLKGSSGPVSINGVNYEAQMPSFTFLKDDELLEILGYVRSLGSNHAIPIKPEVVKEVRASLNK